MHDLKGRYILLHDELCDDDFSITVKDIPAQNVSAVLLTVCAETLESLGLNEDQVRCAIMNALNAIYAKEGIEA